MATLRDELRVLMGQDPYPHVQQATGRSFEQGDLKDWLGLLAGVAIQPRADWPSYQVRHGEGS